MTDRDRVKQILQELRELKECYPMEKYTEIRKLFNVCCDRLDVLDSKLRQLEVNK